jgi:hypothetical protein
VVCVAVAVENMNAGYSRDYAFNLIHYLKALPFGEVGNALNDSLCHSVLNRIPAAMIIASSA